MTEKRTMVKKCTVPRMWVIRFMENNDHVRVNLESNQSKGKGFCETLSAVGQAVAGKQFEVQI
jgi:hypothetical protein